jgi:Recombination endonuclease VII
MDAVPEGECRQMIQEAKACTGCGQRKALDEFYWTTRRNGDKARHSKCRACRREQFSVWARTDRGKAVKRAGILRREYRLTDEEYGALHVEQDGRCAICREPETKLHHTGSLCRLVVDHDHETGEVRGLLCSACNVGLGSFKDSPSRLSGAIAYLSVKTVKDEISPRDFHMDTCRDKHCCVWPHCRCDGGLA